MASVSRSTTIASEAKARYRVEYDEDDVAGDRRRRPTPRRYDVFINHRGLDTKRTVARLLYEQLRGAGVRSFLDNMSMRPGDPLEASIFDAVRECGVAVAIFSKHYCDSDYCLRELASLVEARKTIIPVFYDVEPAELVLPQALLESGEYPPRDIERFRFALREAKRTAGIVASSACSDLTELVSAAANAVMERIQEMDYSAHQQQHQMIVSRL